MWEFTSLVKLDLNNNLIEKIEGLDSLVNLELLSKAKKKLCSYHANASFHKCAGVGEEVGNMS